MHSAVYCFREELTFQSTAARHCLSAEVRDIAVEGTRTSVYTPTELTLAHTHEDGDAFWTSATC